MLHLFCYYNTVPSWDSWYFKCSWESYFAFMNYIMIHTDKPSGAVLNYQSHQEFHIKKTNVEWIKSNHNEWLKYVSACYYNAILRYSTEWTLVATQHKVTNTLYSWYFRDFSNNHLQNHSKWRVYQAHLSNLGEVSPCISRNNTGRCRRFLAVQI